MKINIHLSTLPRKIFGENCRLEVACLVARVSVSVSVVSTERNILSGVRLITGITGGQLTSLLLLRLVVLHREKV